MIIVKKNWLPIRNMYIVIYKYLGKLTKLDTFKLFESILGFYYL